MAGKSNVTKAYEEIKPLLVEGANLETLIEEMATKYNLDGKKKAELNEKFTPDETQDGLTLEERIERLELVIAKLTHYNGTQAILREFGLEPWTPSKKDMSKYNS